MENRQENQIKYGIHPSNELVDLFKEKPFQGQNPINAKVIIIGNDANYSAEISNHTFFKKILEYHSDGIHFWKKYKVHHPFLLEDYPFDKRKDGVRYHMNFNKMRFTSDYAEYFSFVELLDIPTIGNTGNDRKQFFELLDINHLKWLENIIFEGEEKFVLVNQTLAGLVKQISSKFGVLLRVSEAVNQKNISTIILETDNLVLYNGYSFSHTITNDYINSLSNEIKNFIHNNSI